jgi:hypothetical protein
MGKTFGLLLIVAAVWFLVNSYVTGGKPVDPGDDAPRSTPAQRAGKSVERAMEMDAHRYDSQLGE